MVIIYQEQEIIKHVKHIHASSTKLMEKKRKRRKTIEYLLHNSSSLKNILEFKEIYSTL